MQGGQQDDEAAEDEEEGILEGGVRGSAGVCVSIRADWLFRLGVLARVFQGCSPVRSGAVRVTSPGLFA